MLPVLETVPELKYRDPWVLPLDERLRALVRGRVRVAYFYEKADNSTFRYRIYNMAQVLNAQPGEVSASYFFLDDLHALPTIADSADLLVICRARYDHNVNRLIGAFRQRGKRVLFDVDDLVFDTNYAHLVLHTLAQDVRDPNVWDYWFAYTSRIGTTLRMCDGAIATNGALAQQIEQFADVPTGIVPNFVNDEQVALSERVLEAKRAMRLAQDGMVHFGYFSGSPSHKDDLAIAVGALTDAMAADERIGLVLVGYIEVPEPLQRFGKRVRQFPFQDYVNLQRLKGAVEFNIVPLQFNTFTNCKSELKYFEGALVGTLTIASPTYTYSRAIEHGRNGWLAQAHQWRDAIDAALAAMPHYGEMVEAAAAHARANYLGAAQYPAIVQALGLQ